MPHADPSVAAQYQIDYRASRRDELREKQRQWRANNPDYQPTFRLAHLERIADQKRANPNTQARNMAAQARRKQRALGRSSIERVHWTIFQRIALLPCFDCRVEPAKGVDHTIPFCQGGRNVIENLQPACPTCNKRKGGSERA